MRKRKPGRPVEKTIFVPRTSDEFHAIVAQLMKRYKFQNASHVAAVVANRIQHLPPDQATTTLKYLGDCVIKNMAYQVAQYEGSKIQHEMQIDQWIAAMHSNPDDNQARDNIEKAINAGSTYAKEQLNKHFPTPDLQVVSSAV